MLEVILIYRMMTNLLPKSCLEEIQRMQRNFIWRDTDNSKKMHDVNWNIVTLPNKLGGLGLKNL